MKPKTLERLERLLDERDTEIEELQEKLTEAENTIEGIRSGWMRHRKAEDDGALPIPRLEIEWIPRDGWNEVDVEYRLVLKHLLGHVVLLPLGLTRWSSSNTEDPRRQGLSAALPFRDGAHAPHDAALLGLPLYALMLEGPVLVDCRPQAAAEGRGHRRPSPPEKQPSDKSGA